MENFPRMKIVVISGQAFPELNAPRRQLIALHFTAPRPREPLNFSASLLLLCRLGMMWKQLKPLADATIATPTPMTCLQRRVKKSYSSMNRACTKAINKIC